MKPYDCGFFLTKLPYILSSVFQNPNAAYLNSGPSTIPSPLNIGLENSRRFRALPVYSVLLAYGLDGFRDIFVRQTRLARAVAQFLHESKDYELLQERVDDPDASEYRDVHISVLFMANKEGLNAVLAKKVNDTRKIYVSGTSWKGKSACRIAVSTWKVDVERDTRIIIDVLNGILINE
jgi:glutamate/tyrosine decarboxylase-like PLP-dependent enzyme